jgi:transcriptional regulator with XRE-family HTH domain
LGVSNAGHHQAVCAEIIRLLKTERERRKLSKYTVSKRSGVSQSMLSLVERGLRNPTLELTLRIADGIGVDLTGLIKKAQAGVSNKNREMSRGD